MPSSLGPAEILVILVVALIVLGPKRLPEAGRQVGKALSEVRRWSQDVKYEMTQAFDAETAPPMPAADPSPPVVTVPPPADATAEGTTATAPPEPEYPDYPPEWAQLPADSPTDEVTEPADPAAGATVADETPPPDQPEAPADGRS